MAHFPIRINFFLRLCLRCICHKINIVHVRNKTKCLKSLDMRYKISATRIHRFYRLFRKKKYIFLLSVKKKYNKCSLSNNKKKSNFICRLDFLMPNYASIRILHFYLLKKQKNINRLYRKFPYC